MAPLPLSALPLSPPSLPLQCGERPSNGHLGSPQQPRTLDWRATASGVGRSHSSPARSRSLSPSAAAVADFAQLPPPSSSHLPPPARRRLQRHLEEEEEGREAELPWQAERRQAQEAAQLRFRRPFPPPQPPPPSLGPSAPFPSAVAGGPSPPSPAVFRPPLPLAPPPPSSNGGSDGSRGSGGEESDDSADLSSLAYPQLQPHSPSSPPSPQQPRTHPRPPPPQSSVEAVQFAAGSGGGVELFPSSSDSPPFPSLLTAGAALGSTAGSTRSSTPTSATSQSAGSGGALDDSDPDAFTARSWHSQSAACLLRATEAVDVCCHAIVATNATFHHSSSVTLESRRLALTVAVFERSLYAYALRISSARAAAQRSHHRSARSSSNASSTTTTPTFAPAAAAPVLALPSLYSSHAPFVPQQGDFAELGGLSSSSGEWPSLPLSYQSTFPSSTAHSLAASAMASSSRLQLHAQQQHSRFLHSAQQHSSRPQAQQPRAPLNIAAASSPSSSSASTLPPSALPSAFPSLSISPVVSASLSSPSSPIPPTVSMPPSQWVGGYRGTPLMNPSSIPPIPPTVQTPASRSRGRTFSASGAQSTQALQSSPQPPALLHSASYAQPPSQASAVGSSATASFSPYSRSVSPVDLLASPHLSVPSPLSESRSLLPPPSASSQAMQATALVASPPPPATSASPSFVWHQPAGMSCLLRILTHQLLETRSVLLSLNEDCSSFPRYLRHLLHLGVSAPPSALQSIARHPRRVMLAASAASLVSLVHSAPPLQRVRQLARKAGEQLWGRGAEHLSAAWQSSATAFLLSFVPPSIQSSLLTVFAVLSPHVLLPQLRSAVHTRAAFTIIPLCLWLVYRLSRYRRVAHLRSLHSRLGLLLRLWHICFSLLGSGQPQLGGGGGGASSQSGRGEGGGEERRSEWDDDSLVLQNREAARVPISRWLLELVPPELDASFWYHSSFRLSLVKYGLDVLYSAVQEWHRLLGCRAVGAPWLLLSAVFYACQPHLAASTASRLMASPDIEVVRHAWQLLDTPVARRLVIQALPAIAAVPRLAVCKEVELCDVDESDQHRLPSYHHQHRAGGSRSQGGGRKGSGGSRRGRGGGEASDEEDEGRFEVELSPGREAGGVLRFDASPLGREPTSQRHLRRYQRAVASSRLRESLSSLDEEADNAASPDPTLKLLLLSARPLRLTLNLRFHRVPSQSHVRSARPTSSPVLLYFHGGGFFTDFRASHLHFLSQWAASLDVPILYVNYSLAPDNAYPTALNECYDVYRWVVEGRLGLNASHITLVGDSTGGNLAAAVCMKAIIDQIRIPDAVVLACPILNLRLTPTPSRSLYMMDAVLPMNLLLQCMTGDHRVLTRTGWKSITRVQVGDEVMSFNKDTYAQEWKEVLAVESHVVDPDDPDDELYRMEGSGMDVIATRDHRMLVVRVSQRTDDGLQAETPIDYDTVEELLPPHVSTHSKLSPSQQRLVVRAGINLQPAVQISIPELEEVCHWWWQKDEQRGFLRFLGFWLGDGHLGTQMGYVCLSPRQLEATAWADRAARRGVPPLVVPPRLRR